MHKTTEELLLHLMPGTGVVQFVPGPRSRGQEQVMSGDVVKLRQALQSGLYSEVLLSMPVYESAVDELVAAVANSESVKKFSCWGAKALPSKTLWSLCAQAPHVTDIEWTMRELSPNVEHPKLPRPVEAFRNLTSFSVSSSMYSITDDFSLIINAALRCPALQTLCVQMSSPQYLPVDTVFDGVEHTQLREVRCDFRFSNFVVHSVAADDYVPFLSRLLHLSPQLRRLSWRLHDNHLESELFVHTVCSHPKLVSLTIFSTPRLARTFLTAVTPHMAKFETLLLKNDNDPIAFKMPKSGFCYMGDAAEAELSATQLEACAHRFNRNVTNFAVSNVKCDPMLYGLQFVRSLTLHHVHIDRQMFGPFSPLRSLEELVVWRCKNVELCEVLDHAQLLNLKTFVLDNNNWEVGNFNNAEERSEKSVEFLNLLTSWLRRRGCRLQHFGFRGDQGCALTTVESSRVKELFDAIGVNASLKILDLTDCLWLLHCGNQFADVTQMERLTHLSHVAFSTRLLEDRRGEGVTAPFLESVSVVNISGARVSQELTQVLKRNRLTRIFVRTCSLCVFWCARQTMGRDVARILAVMVWETRVESCWTANSAAFIRSSEKWETIVRQAPFELAIPIENSVIERATQGRTCNIL